MNRRLFLLAATLVAAVFCLGDGCGVQVTAIIVQAPQQVGSGDTALVAVCSDVNATAPVWVRYILNWGDESVDTTRDYFKATDTVRFSHVWHRPGTYTVVVTPDEFGRDADGKSKHIHPMESQCHITVVSTGHEPVIYSFTGPDYTAIDAETRFVVAAGDPDGDSIALHVDWGDGDSTDSAYFPTPCTVELTHVYTGVDTFWVKAFCTDVWGIESHAESLELVVGQAGAVICWWQGFEREPWSHVNSPVVVGSGEQERIYIATEEGFGSLSRSSRPHGDQFYPGCFISHPSYSGATGHIYAASEEGQLYAFDTGLVPAWRYPDNITYVEWGSAAVKGNRLYVPRGDSIFCLVDNGLSATREAAFGPSGKLVDAPVIDATGNVYFGTDSGYLYKLGPDLSLVWHIRLLANGKVSGLALRSDGVLYCTSDSGAGRLYAVNPDSVVAWSVPTNGRGSRPAVGRDDNVYFGTETGWFSQYDRVTGTVLWERHLGTSAFATTPVITANLYVYIQDEFDVLYCFEQGDGDLAWACDCPASLPRPAPRGRRMQPNDFPPNPTILSDGNIVVAGQDAVYLVKGYAEGPLDLLAPWPKWQHDLHNTGCVTGGK